MNKVRERQEGTVFEGLIKGLLSAGEYNQGVEQGPVVILWPDEKGQWQPLIPRLKERFSGLYELGEYGPEERRGPAIWLRYMLSQGLSEGESGDEESADGEIPIFYLPGVSRADLRAVDECPEHLKALAELQYRGVIWSQDSGRDWSVTAFLKSEDGGGLDIARDQGTQEAMLRALPMLVDENVESLRGFRLAASDFDLMSTPDPIRDLLHWISSPEEVRGEWSQERWESFCAIAKREMGFDPEGEGALSAAELLAAQRDGWAKAWERFAEAPTNYPGIRERLEQAHPNSLFLENQSSWPIYNQQEEEKLRDALREVSQMSAVEARAKVLELEAEHGRRREWIWRVFGLSVLAVALKSLAELAELCGQSLGGTSAESMAKRYADGGWRADRAALEALTAVSSAEDVGCVQGALIAIYRPWLDEGARHLQKLVEEQGYPGARGKQEPVRAEGGEVLFFADGLRFDVAVKLRERLEARGFVVEESTRWSALPSVTPTAKPAVSPVADEISGSAGSEDFNPGLKEGGKALDITRFRKLLDRAGYEVLRDGAVGDPKGRGWTEEGQIDRIGHDDGWKLARRIDEEVREMVERVEALFDGGWRKVRIITDHGWLLMPGGLPKVELPKALVDSRWGRCATLKSSTSGKDLDVVDWHWSPEVRIALAPGIGCFKAGVEYTHGGLSLQECFTPVLEVSAGEQALLVSIDGVSWAGLRCRVELSGHDERVEVDLRTKPDDPASSVVGAPKVASLEGPTTLLVGDYDLEGAAVHVVAICGQQVVAKVLTSVGGG